MSTGDKLVNFFVDRLLSRSDLDTYLTQYLKDLITDSLSALFQGRSGVLDESTIDLAADGADQFLLDVTNADKAVDGFGNILTVVGSVVGESRNLYFENVLGIPYYVGLKYGTIYSDVDVNPRKGNAEYRTVQDVIGEVGEPDSFVDTSGSNLKVIVDSVTEAGVSNEDRKAKIYLTNPVSSDPSVAFFEADIQWDGSNNYIDIPYSPSAGPLGQDVSTDPPSTTPSDYEVWVKGPSVRRNTDLSLDSDYAFIGIVEGAGSGNPPSVFDMSNQFSVFLYSLDAAYNGIGSGAGNTINVDTNGKPVLLKGFTGVSDIRPDLHHVFNVEDFDGDVFQRLQSFGRIEGLPRFFDGFDYNPGLWTSSATCPSHVYAAGATGGGYIRMKAANTSPDLGAQSSGVCQIVCDGAAGNSALLEGPTLRVEGRVPAFYCRIAPVRLTDQEAKIGLKLHAALYPGFGFTLENSELKGYTEDTTPTLSQTAVLHTFVGDDLVDCYAVCFPDSGSSTNFSIAYWVTGMTTPAILDAPLNFAAMPATSWDWDLNAYLESGGSGTHPDLTLWLDAWEAWTRGDVIGA